MTTRSLEDAFACFRDGHDLEALAEVFDRTAPRLLEVARHLSRGRGEAEDLVQATFLAAIEGRERFEPGRELVPWLLGILSNLARRARERRRAVGEPDVELADPRGPDPAARAAEVEFRAALEGALGRVPATYREVLREHLGDGRPPEELARALGREPGTVRVQLHRGFRLLRRLLPAGLGLGLGALLAPRGLAAVRAEVLRAASRSAAVPASTAASLTALGGMLMAKKVALVAAVVAALVASWWGTRKVRRPETASEPAAAVPEVSLASPPDEVRAPGQEGPSREPLVETPASAASDEPYGALALELTWWDGTPAEEVTVRLEPGGERQSNLHYQIPLTDAEGHARTDRIHEGWVVIEILRLGLNGRYQTEVRPGLTTTERIAIPRGCDVEGRVVDAHGAPAGGASLWMKESLAEPAQNVGRAASDGSFLARSLPEGCEILATADGRGSSAPVELKQLETVDANTRRTELRLRGESAELAGRITDASGAPIAGALVSVWCANDRQGTDLRRWGALEVAGDADGSFRIGGLHGGRARVQVAAPDFAAWQKDVKLEADHTTSLDVVVDRGFSVEGSFTAPPGSSMTDARVLLSPDDPFAIRDLWTAPDSDRRYLLERIPAGKALVIASVGVDERAPRVQKRIGGRPGETLRWDVVFGAGSAIRGRALDESGRALTGWRVSAIPKMGTGGWRSAEIASDAQGGFVISDLVDDAPYDVLAYAPEDEQHSQPRARVEGVLAGGASIELVVHGERAPSAFLTGRVLDPDGKPVRPSQIWAYSEDELDSVGDPQWSEGERFRMGPMLAGAYRLSLSVAGFPGSSIDFVLTEGEEHDLGDITLERPGRVRLTFRGGGGQPIGDPLSVYLQGGRFAHTLTSSAAGVYESDDVFPGSYGLRVMHGAFAPDRLVSIDVQAGETTSMELSLVHARTVTLELRVPEGEPMPRRVRCELRDGQGGVMADFLVGRMISPGKPDRLGDSLALPLGRYRYSMRSSDGWSAAGELEVRPGDSWSQWETVSLSR